MIMLNDYLVQIVQVIVSVIFGMLGIAIRRMMKAYINNDAKHTVAKDVVQAVEQIYKDLHGEEKLNAAIYMFAEQLRGNGISISDDEMRILIESAVNEFNRKRTE